MKNKFNFFRLLFPAVCIFSFISVHAQTWTAVSSFGGGSRYGGVALSIGNKGYMGTGMISPSNLSNDFWEYDPVTNAWTQKANFGGSARFHAMSFTVGNKGYVGLGSSGYPAYNFVRDVWEYDPVTNSWTQKAMFPGPGRYTTVSFSIGSKGYVGTGWSNGPLYRDFWEYTPATNTWTQKADFGGTSRQSAVGFALNGFGYVGTGYDGSNCSDFWKYDPATNSWSACAAFPGSARFSASVFTLNGYGVVGSGTDGPTLFTNFWKYNPSTNSWSALPSYPGSAKYAMSYFSLPCSGFNGTGATSTGGAGSITSAEFYKLSFPVLPDTLLAANPCFGDSCFLSITNHNGFVGCTWNFGDPASGLNNTSLLTNPSHLFSAIGTYAVRCIINYGCESDTLTKNITVIQKPIAQIIGLDTICSGTAVVLNGSGGTTFSWSGDTIASSSSIQVAPNIISTYYLEVSQNGCTSDPDTFIVYTISQAISPIAYTFDTCLASFRFYQTGASALNYQWKFGDGSQSSLSAPTHSYSSPGSYYVFLVVNTGTTCSGTDSVLVTYAQAESYSVFVPNVFTPNADGRNDVFYLSGSASCQSGSLKIFNRWGKLLFQTEQPFSEFWDGTYSGHPVPEGVYVWLLDLPGAYTSRKGTVHIMR